MKSIWLTYHDIFSERLDSSLSFSASIYHLQKDVFRKHMELLIATGKQTLSVSDYLKNETINDSIVLTFDDGWNSFQSIALPILVELGITPTIFITRDFIGKPRFLSKSSLEELANLGVDIGIHGTTHRMLSDCSIQEMEWEFMACKDFLEDLTNKPINIASLPGGDLNKEVLIAARNSGIIALCTSQPGLNNSKTNFLYNRLTIKRRSSEKQVRRFVNNNINLEVFWWSVFQTFRAPLGGKKYALLRRNILRVFGSPEDNDIYVP
jgi:peptidoglycan/xylan/chitin deacetylase (PgdA/CDA1 family)